MCGIVGILGTDAVAGALVDALRRLEYRGYDSAGVATVENAHLDMNDRVAVVHNGIIENFQELREELTARGHAFQTETDTETVLHLITDGLDQGLVPVAAAKTAL